MSDFAIQELYQKWIELDRELKELKEEVGKIKFVAGKPGHGPCYVDVMGYVATVSNPDLLDTPDHLHKGQCGTFTTGPDMDKPAQWPNEPYTDYLKRIGEYNEAQVYEDDAK